MIISFGDQETQNVFERIGSRKLPSLIQKTALRKLAMLHAATQLPDLLIPPGNKLERLRGDKKGRYSIRINDQWRICFEWQSGNASEVTIEDYH